jgi:hypothetical protein
MPVQPKKENTGGYFFLGGVLARPSPRFTTDAHVDAIQCVKGFSTLT